MRLRYVDIQNSRIPAKVGVCAASDELLQWSNAFESRAAAFGRWWGSTQLTQFCVTGSACGGACVVLPPQVDVIEAATLNGVPVAIQNMWGAFGQPHLWWGQRSCGGVSPQGWRCTCGCGCAGVPQMLDEGLVPSFSVTAAGQKIRIYSVGVASTGYLYNPEVPGPIFNPDAGGPVANPEAGTTTGVDSGKYVVFQGNDSNGVWVRTQFADGTWQDGEQVALTYPYGETVTSWAVGSPYAAYKDVTTQSVYVFAVEDDSTLRNIAIYGPDETNPTYRKVRLPSVRCPSSATQTLRALVSLQPGSITGANSWLSFADALPAYSDGILAEKYYENGDVALGDTYFFGAARPARNARGVLRSSVGAGALGFLESLLRKRTGDRTTVAVRRDGLSLAGFV